MSELMQFLLSGITVGAVLIVLGLLRDGDGSEEDERPG